MFSTIQHDQEKVHNLTLLPQEGRKRVECPGFWLFSGMARGLVSNSGTNRELVYFGCLVAAENKGELSSLLL